MATSETPTEALSSPSGRAVIRPNATPPTINLSSSSSSSRLLIISNRLPFSMKIERVENGPSKFSFAPSSGGLVSALQGISLDMVWCGWPGDEVTAEADQQRMKQELEPKGLCPVFLNAAIADSFYNGFCNNILWPLFHYRPLPMEALQGHDDHFAAYVEANIEFSKAVIALYKPGDLVWIHDYHLMLLPALLRKVHPDMKIGFFFHIPFPSSEIYRALPSREQLLQGVLVSNLIGFHTTDYVRHFAMSCQRICGAQCSSNFDQVRLGTNTAALGSFPIGIDPERFINALSNDQQVKSFLKELQEQFAGRKVILGVDRLDYIKGIPNKLLAYERFFENNPEWIGKCVLIQIGIPSRQDVLEYQKLRSTIHEMVGRINGKYGSIANVPIHYLDQSVAFPKLTALYSISDVMFITSVRDGMNLVAYEFIACQDVNKGVLILSEFAGAAQSLSSGISHPACLVVNPHDINQTADALHRALTMEDTEKEKFHRAGFEYIKQNTSARWARKFVSGLRSQPLETPKAGGRNLIASSSSQESSKDWDSDDGLVQNSEIPIFAPGRGRVKAFGSSFASYSPIHSTSHQFKQLNI